MRKIDWNTPMTKKEWVIVYGIIIVLPTIIIFVPAIAHKIVEKVKAIKDSVRFNKNFDSLRKTVKAHE